MRLILYLSDDSLWYKISFTSNYQYIFLDQTTEFVFFPLSSSSRFFSFSS